MSRCAVPGVVTEGTTGKLRRAALVAVLLANLMIPALAPAQDYPMPASAPVPCTTAGCETAGLPTPPYAYPVIRHRGRYLDSTQVRDIQYPIRTLRARRVAIVSERDRIYMRIGSTFAAYRLSTFFKSDLDEPMVSLEVTTRPVPEQYLEFFDSVYPEDDPKWVTGPADGQDRLGEGFDWDDRGYIYLPYKIYGWGIYKDASRLEFVKQYQGDSNLSLTAASIISVKDGGKYYAVVADDSLTALVLDVSDPANATRVGTLEMPIGQFAKAQLNGKQVIAIVTGGDIRIYSPNALITGAAPEKVILKTGGGNFTSVSSDGIRFFGGEYTSTGTNVVTIEATGTSIGSFLATRTAVSGVRFVPQRVTYSSGTLAITGGSMRGLEVYLFRVAGNSLQQVDLGNFFNAYYTGWWENGVRTYASPGQCTIADTAVVYKEGGKEYLVVAMTGLGDVYEIESDGISIMRDTAASAGTPNPHSEGVGGPFYGDRFRFLTAIGGDAAPILVDFGNPEAATGNTVTAMTGEPLAYRYSGLWSAAAIQQTRAVRITLAADPSRSAAVDVTMAVPTARIRAIRSGGVKDPDLLITGSDQMSRVPLVVGDSFVDASDGSVESHVASWALDGSSAVAQLPSAPFGAGGCGAHSLSFKASYGANRNLILVTAPDYTPSIANFRYSVRPFAVRIAVASADQNGVRFHGSVRVGAGSIPAGTAATAAFTWDLLDAAGRAIRSAQVTSTLGAPPDFSVTSTELAGAKSVRLTVALSDAAAVVGVGCSAMTSASDSMQLSVPDPVLTVSGCATVGSACSITVASGSGQNQSGWTYAWYLNDVQKAITTAASYTPAPADIAQAGTYRVKVRVRTEQGVTTDSSAVTFTLQTPPCGAIPDGALSFTWTGTDGCLPGACTAASTLRFEPKGWGYAFQGCDRFRWSFGDGMTSTAKFSQHKYSADGSYSVTLTVTNEATPGGRVATEVVLLGAPAPSCNAPKTDRAFIEFAAPSGCSSAAGASPCKAGEVVTLSLKTADAFQACDVFDWDFGDGTTLPATTRTVQHQFPATKAEYAVTVTVRNAAGSARVTQVVRVDRTGEESGTNEFTYLLPVVSHLDGANGSRWRTDLEIYNGNAASGPVELELELTSAKITKTLTLNVATLIYEDFMTFFTDADAAGPVILRGSAPRDLQIWTRTYSVDASGSGTYGHLIPAIRIDGHQSLTGGASNLYLTGLSHTPKYRTNVYLLNITGSTIPVTITAYDGELGSTVGQLSKGVAPFELTPLSAGEIPGAPTTGPFSVAVQASSGGLIAYQSVVDNGSNDPIYIPAIATSDLDDPEARTQILPSVGHFQSWRSDLTIFNPDDQELRFDLAFHDGDGTLKAEATNLTLPPKALLQLDDVVRSSAMTPPIAADVIGILRVTVTSPLSDRFPVIAQRNYSDSGDHRRFGQGILGFTPAKANVSPGWPAILPAVRSDSRYYSNVGLANIGSTDASVALTLLDQNDGQVIGTHTLAIRPNESRILQDVIRFLHPTEDRASIRVEATGGTIWAFASIIDRVTKDPEYVPAIPLD